MNHTSKALTFVFLISLVLPSLAESGSMTKVTRTSPNHTEIIIHDRSPEARARRDLEADRARRRIQRQRERQTERLDAARDQLEARRAANRASLPSIADRRESQVSQPPAFFNGGQFTGFGFGTGFGGFYGGFGFAPYGYGYGPYAFRGRGFRGGFNRGFHRPGFRNGFRGRGFRNGFRGRGFRGRY